MSEGATEQAQDEKVLYPGRLAEYHKIKAMREKVAETENELEVPSMLHVGLLVAEQLAGLNYIQDGIRFSARNK